MSTEEEDEEEDSGAGTGEELEEGEDASFSSQRRRRGRPFTIEAAMNALKGRRGRRRREAGANPEGSPVGRARPVTDKGPPPAPPPLPPPAAPSSSSSSFPRPNGPPDLPPKRGEAAGMKAYEEVRTCCVATGR